MGTFATLGISVADGPKATLVQRAPARPLKRPLSGTVRNGGFEDMKGGKLPFPLVAANVSFAFDLGH